MRCRRCVPGAERFEDIIRVIDVPGGNGRDACADSGGPAHPEGRVLSGVNGSWII